jgi:hypothetical protein
MIDSIQVGDSTPITESLGSDESGNWSDAVVAYNHVAVELAGDDLNAWTDVLVLLKDTQPKVLEDDLNFMADSFMLLEFSQLSDSFSEWQDAMAIEEGLAIGVLSEDLSSSLTDGLGNFIIIVIQPSENMLVMQEGAISLAGNDRLGLDDANTGSMIDQLIRIM